MEIGEIFRHLEQAINNTQLGNSTGLVAGFWGLIRVSMPVVREWIAARSAASGRLKNENAASYKIAFENAAQQAIKDHAAWDIERAHAEAQIKSLQDRIDVLEARLDQPGHGTIHES